MFDSANLEHVVDKERYRREEPKLREALLNAQFDVAQAARFPVVIVIGGVEGAGKSETVNLLSEWMDPRHLLVHAFSDASDEERDRPRMWRYWRALPPKGKVGIRVGAWHSQPIVRRVMGRLKPDGVLYTGHAESLSNLGLPVRIVSTAVHGHA